MQFLCICYLKPIFSVCILTRASRDSKDLFKCFLSFLLQSLIDSFSSNTRNEELIYTIKKMYSYCMCSGTLKKMENVSIS